MGENELKPCPFCGNKAHIYDTNEHNYIGGYSIDLIVECDFCGANISTYYGKHVGVEVTRDTAEKNLIESWNNRI